jgi:predicted nicotinamide N-methyase
VNVQELVVSLGEGLEIVVLRPVDQERLLRDAIDRPNQGLPDGGTPYFAELWPAAIPMAKWLRAQGVGRSERVLELGCGLGLVGLALAKALDARVTLTDGSPAALDLVRRVLPANGPFAHEPLVERLDWREPAVAERYPIVIGADVLYAPEAFPWLAKAARACVAPGGRLFLAEPQRPVARSAARFLEAEGFVPVRASEAENGVVVQEWRPARDL